MIGERLAHFRITAELGKGGMGEVWRAEDTRLGREVALKILPRAFVEDSERLARFQREAKVLASLNHPNIAAVHEVREEEGVHFLVMELAPGETLAHRIERGPIPVDEAVAIALQIAAGLEAAHERKIVHRDLKPANIKVDSRGRVKILDFGLAKALGPGREGGSGPGETAAPTATFPSTDPGTVLGTAAYMSPEQARGETVDGRTDLWALGSILFEMLSGRRLFEAGSLADTLAAVLEAPIDLEALPGATPPPVRRLLRRLLQRDLDLRLRHPGDAWLELRDAREQEPERSRSPAPEDPVEPPPARSGSFVLSMEICRHLDRESLVPEMIDDSLELLDNERESEVLAVYLPSLGADRELFREIVERSSFRGLAVTPYGWEEDADLRPPIPLRDHLTILARLVEDAVSRIRPRDTILVGFSSGSDMALRLPSEAAVEVPSLDGILALGPNLNLDTAFYTSRLASIRSKSSGEMLDTLREIGSSTDSVEEWAMLVPYLRKVALKFGSDVGTLQKVAAEIVAPFEDADDPPFAAWYRSVRQQGIEVRALFSNATFDREGLAELRMDHLDSGILGPDFQESDLVTERDRNHFELLDAELVETRIGELVEAIRSPRAG
ncbi:MAG: serine/threonine-protein kinase [Thermoanaerobaculia bacterium]|nr:serine/threonine-protein kinase [Thermoanaerobaculia bacterium]